MTSITFAVPDKMKEEINNLSWVNWSALAKIVIEKRIKRNKALAKISKITRKSKLTEKDSILLANRIKETMWASYKED